MEKAVFKLLISGLKVISKVAKNIVYTSDWYRMRTEDFSYTCNCLYVLYAFF